MELEVLALPHADDGLDGLLPLLAARLAVDTERDLLHRRGAAGAPLDPPAREHVGGGNLLRDAHRRGERVGHQRHAEPEADLLGDLRQRADDHLGRGRVRATLAEVVLDVPGGVEPELVGQLDLLERLPIGLLLGLPLAVRMWTGPRLRDVDLVEQVQLHRHPSVSVVCSSER